MEAAYSVCLMQDYFSTVQTIKQEKGEMDSHLKNRKVSSNSSQQPPHPGLVCA